VSDDLQDQIDELREALETLTARVAVLESMGASDISKSTAQVARAQLTGP
jgi:hypothetical protein